MSLQKKPRFDTPSPDSEPELSENPQIPREKLEAAYRRYEELASAERDPTEAREEILELRRRLREGRQLRAGDALQEDRYQLLGLLGQGGYGMVWKAYDRELHRLVAVKILHGQFAEDRTRHERFFRGARKMAELQHQGIVQILEKSLVGEGYKAFVMEYVNGGDLRRAVLEGRLTPEEGIQIIVQVGKTLHFAHQQGVIHRDVKPANILLDQQGTPKLSDFDLVRAPDTTGGTRTGKSLGTFLYTAPEALRNSKTAGPAADIFSLGMTAIFVLYGAELPVAVLRDPRSIVEVLRCSARLRETLVKASAWDVSERFHSMVEFCRELGGGDRMHEADGTVLVYVPEGEYILGAEDLDADARPIHLVRLTSYWIGKHPVTNAQYARFLEANPDVPPPEHWDDPEFNQPQQPVVGVSWGDARSYCAWAGLVLPTEAQWEAAARGTDQRRYPWGNEEPAPLHANFQRRNGRTTPVGAYSAVVGPHGTLDQAGNVWEWCADAWVPDAYRQRDGQVDPVAEVGDPQRYVLRGGAWSESADMLASAFRDQNVATHRSPIVGFRCVLSTWSKYHRS